MQRLSVLLVLFVPLLVSTAQAEPHWSLRHEARPNLHSFRTAKARPGFATDWTPSFSKPSAPRDCIRLPKRIAPRSFAVCTSTLPDCRQRRRKSPLSSRTKRRTLMRNSSIGCSRRRIMANAGRSTGSTWCAMPRRTASSTTAIVPACGVTAITSSRRFNDDKPYDRFVQEQLAGDEIDPDSQELQIAAGFYRLGSGAAERRQRGNRVQPQ